jgi:hypothetical protein
MFSAAPFWAHSQRIAGLCTIGMKWSNDTVKASTGRMISLTAGLSMLAETEKHMDGEMQCFA